MSPDNSRPPSFLERYAAFFARDVWVLELSALSWAGRTLVRLVRIVSIVVRGFIKDSCPLRASALTYVTILSLVPLLAFAFSLAKAFKADLTPLQSWIVENIALGNLEIGNRIFDYVSNISASTLGPPALAMLIFSIISVMSNIESSFNHIWGAPRGRTPWRMFTDYLSVLIVSPLLILAGIGVTGTLHSQATVVALMKYEVFRTAWVTVFRVASFLLPCLGFTFLYVFMPNTRVRPKAAAAGGLIGGIAWQFALWGYVTLQVGAAGYTRLYGAMAVVFINLVWFYISWLIVLLGSEVSFAVQNVNTYEWEGAALASSWAYQEVVALNLLLRIGRGFLAGAKPLAAEELSNGLRVPVRLVNLLLHQMSEGGLLNELAGGRGRSFQPAQDLSRLTVARVLSVLRNAGGVDAIPPYLKDSPAIGRLRERILRAVEEAGGSTTLEELIREEERGSAAAPVRS